MRTCTSRLIKETALVFWYRQMDHLLGFPQGTTIAVCLHTDSYGIYIDVQQVDMVCFISFLALPRTYRILGATQGNQIRGFSCIFRGVFSGIYVSQTSSFKKSKPNTDIIGFKFSDQ